MPLLLIGLNHQSAPVEVREKLASLCGHPVPEADGATMELVPVFTCNRVEWYWAGGEEQVGGAFHSWLQTNGLDPAMFEPHFYRRREVEVAHHLMRVTSGLDSMILGESQIMGQVKTSYQSAISEKTVGKRLHTLFQKAMEVGKRVRSETRIGENTVSIASTAVDLARRIFDSLSQTTALVIGAGEMANLAAVHLRDQGVGKLVFTNRTFSRAEELAAQFQGQAEPFDGLETLLGKADVVISSTGAPRPILGRELLTRVMGKRPLRPLFLIDIAVPRDVEAGCDDIENLFPYNIDDLQGVVDENLGQRRIEAEKAEAIVHYEAGQFQATLDSFTVVPLIRSLRERAEEIRRTEVERLLHHHQGELTPELIEAIDRCTRSLMAKWLHSPIVGLKERGTTDQKNLQMIAELFGLPEEAVPSAPLYGLPDKTPDEKTSGS